MYTTEFYLSILFDRFPHMATNTKIVQWLGNGYYFWTDSCKNAHWWGKNRLKSNYCITEYSVDLDGEFLLDMSGNVEHIEYFYELKKFFEKKCSESDIDNPSISDLIGYFRKFHKEKLFKFKAIKIHHNLYDKSYKLNMTPNSKEYFQGLPRIQLCVFPEEKECIKDKIPYYPEDYQQAIISAV